MNPEVYSDGIRGPKDMRVKK